MPAEVWNKIVELAVLGLLTWNIFTLQRTTIAVAKLEANVDHLNKRMDRLEE